MVFAEYASTLCWKALRAGGVLVRRDYMSVGEVANAHSWFTTLLSNWVHTSVD